ncbi:HNH endonuclease [Pseudomonas aeruginosa]|uniref:HNH endonuclease n=1 Tax=Pseudomonas aeruginosa TaxID=287 RepID=UPI0018C49DED|nr:HNH endonuclease [Pseudomonas aeruginosa]MBG3977157.1 HNH endonuclease [Pseudomonas aeruginosa]MBG5691786.1 HNH endonuclease [Pseudomonas aeruginosa]MBG6882969.1 HNH endonuclease [Pseudomonas aeruginosa]MDI3598749.1 HNH endonuclease [Pseudomonas aeruginosa]MDI3764090.1 HNH endonuclease [Pseudomonas aeruginosa]
MILPNATAAKLERAIKLFDRDLRDTQEWDGWEENRAHRYAIKWQGRLYPAKKIVSLATGTPVGHFSGGIQTNGYLRARGFEVINLRGAENSPFKISFEVGEIYDRREDIHGPFGGSKQSGISPSKKAPVVFLFTGDSGKQYGYQDHFDEAGVYHYTGEGQSGDMRLSGGNKAVLNHAQEGRSLHLFKSLGKKAGKSLGQKYLGEFVCADHYWAEGEDREGNRRAIVIFQLVRLNSMNEAGIEDDVDEPKPPTLDDARKLALQAIESGEQSATGNALRNIYKRSVKVKNYVLMRAAGLCESCGEDAPFKRKDGSPYLEPHHINRLSDGGLDHPRFIGAVCPACHREIHYGLDGDAKNERLRIYVASLEQSLN